MKFGLFKKQETRSEESPSPKTSVGYQEAEIPTKDIWGKPLLPYCAKCGTAMRVHQGSTSLWWVCPKDFRAVFGTIQWAGKHSSQILGDSLPSRFDPNTGERIV